MKRRELTLLIVVLGLMACSAGALVYLRSNQHLGLPGVKGTPIEGEVRMKLDLPESVPGYEMTVQTNMDWVKALPPDTSAAQAIYTDKDGWRCAVTAVLMGTDRTSIHQPQFCLVGQGWNIDESRSTTEMVHIKGPEPFDIPVRKLVSSRAEEANGRQVQLSGIYVYWFVAHDAVTSSHKERMWLMAEHLVRSGELQRWAYISYFEPCYPGQEEEAFNRIKKLMNLTVPEFQLPRPGTTQTAGAER